MCGRYTLQTLTEVLKHFFEVELPARLLPRYNIAPTQAVLAITNEAPDRMQYFRWGLVPSWAKQQSVGNQMINARAETLGQKPAFKKLLARRRCLVPADGFYEWRKEADGETKTPMYIRLRDRNPFAFAGLWDTWRCGGDGQVLPTLTLITTLANELMTPIHNRMPVILRRDRHKQWLDPLENRADVLTGLLEPYEAGAMEAYPVSRTVNSPANEVPQCIEPVAAPPPTTLFG